MMGLEFVIFFFFFYILEEHFFGSFFLSRTKLIRDTDSLRGGSKCSRKIRNIAVEKINYVHGYFTKKFPISIVAPSFLTSK